MTREYLEIHTPENLTIEYELAGIGSRTIAITIDTLLQILISIVLAIPYSMMDVSTLLAASKGWFMAFNILILFIDYWGYYVIFEMLMKGRTPGKKIAGLRTIKENGQPITFMNSFIRNLFRVADDLVGIIFVICSKRYKRIGDYAAGTVVIKEMKLKKKARKTVKGFTIMQISNKINDGNEGDDSNYIRITNKEYRILQKFLERKKSMDKYSRINMASELSQYFKAKSMDESLKRMNNEQFLEYLYNNNKIID